MSKYFLFETNDDGGLSLRVFNSNDELQNELDELFEETTIKLSDFKTGEELLKINESLGFIDSDDLQENTHFIIKGEIIKPKAVDIVTKVNIE